ncbi:hypothetical protein HG535_0B00340 [Zygotorulaspora mrakii]|uniref:AmmeMemoRadiSam system protein B n=1 Tax=Zygotorulaspora mrakii TaxID=42260 RepID=A0A7H9AXM9_ZYGMR|nr:uncharacterized protein HG535_0B00340 [Zygotorulaspora mrakii]QLG70996.1 hypothetical protein HG535_0B00340 [Zygotorulaspora mrakii]
MADSVRLATHAGTWYSNHASELSSTLQSYLNNTGKKSGSIPGARIVVSPHAGYRYCGPTMAHSYACLDINSDVKKVFIIGPSHHVYFKNKVLLTKFKEIETPIGKVKVDQEITEDLLRGANKEIFGFMDAETDLNEHSLEMQFPMLIQTLKWRKKPPEEVEVVPLLVSHNSTDVDYAIGRVLKEYLKDPTVLFILSSDFCHWGRRFGYTGYCGMESELDEAIGEETEIEMLTSRSKLSHHQLDIWQSIELIDRGAMRVLSDSKNDSKYNMWKKYLEITGDTICGAKPIAIVLSAISFSEREVVFKWPHYSQSSKVSNLNDSSVSYAAGYATLL